MGELRHELKDSPAQAVRETLLFLPGRK